jgi:hypothetical protein
MPFYDEMASSRDFQANKKLSAREKSAGMEFSSIRRMMPQK